MMRTLYKASLFLLATLLLMACSRKKNTFLNRNMHTLATGYNVLYNGELAYEDAKDQLAAGFQENFWEILPIERIEIDEVILDDPTPKRSGDFSRAEEKATKAIQKHSMSIQGKEYNSKIDDAYLLLGKARYYDGRFIPALDAFNFILDRYPSSNSVNKAKVWRAKVNIRLDNEEYAIENLKQMLKQGEIEMEDQVDAHAMLAEAYINLDSIPQALEYIKIASENEKDRELKGRYTFIKGQLYNHLQEKDSANMAFDEVIAMNRRIPRAYLIQAHMEKIRNFDYENDDHERLLKLFDDLAKNRENRPFLDRIFHQTAEYYRNTDSVEAAVAYYNKSIQNFKRDRILQSKNYYTLAEINFEHAEYRTAGAYYDSTLTFLAERSRDWRRVKKKRENLDDVIRYEDIAVSHDSILRLVNMTEAQQLAFFTEYTDKLKEQAIQDSIARAKEEREITDMEFYSKGKSKQGDESGTFYFYNQTTIAHGKQTFRTIWGDRRLEDNWRLSTKKTTLELLEDEEDELRQDVPIAENELFKPETYIARIPTEEKVIDSLVKDRNFAYYQLGLIYKEKFKELELAAERLETLLTYKPEDRLVVASEYHLVRIYEDIGRDERAAYFKNDILNNFADTRYAEILRNPNVLLDTDESSPEFKYKQLYGEFENHQYADVIEKVEEYIVIYEGTELVPKFELLKATAIGRQDGFEAYKKALNFVSLNYPNSEEGVQAQEIYDNVLPGLASSEFIGDDESEKWKLVYKFPKEDHEAALDLKTKLEEAIAEMNYTNLKVSLDYYDPKDELVIIHGMRSKLGARGFGDMLKENKEYKVKKEFFEISSPNYKTVQMHKNLEDYLEQVTVSDTP
jgi:tetratricopeptide (TPR) repeat protein